MLRSGQAIDQAYKLANRFGLAPAAFRATRQRLRILCYHGIWDVPGRHFAEKLFMSPALFEQRLEQLREMRCSVLDLSTALRALREGTLPPRAVCITIDDGWASTFRTMVPALKRFGFPATLYMRTDKMADSTPICPVAVRYALERTPRTSVDVVSLKRILSRSPLAHEIDVNEIVHSSPASMLDSIVEIGKLIEAMGGEQIDAGLDAFYEILGLSYSTLQTRRAFHLGTPDDLREAFASGLDVQLHTHRHYLGDLSPEWVVREVVDNRAALVETLEVPESRFNHFCYPSGRYAPALFGALEALGIQSATTTDPGLASKQDHLMALPRILDGEHIGRDRFAVLVSGLKSVLGRS
jgi:peptidoglycan/xylan/chitin deacetylase (PgdA/CDA1 family)